MKKRTVSLLMACALLAVSLLSGCGAKETDETPDWLEGKDFSEHLEISISYWEIEEMAANTQADAVQAYIEDLFNITIKPISVSWSNYKEYYQMLEATENLPDVFANLTISSSDTNDSATYEEYIRSGTVRAIPEDLSAYPNLAHVFEEAPSLQYTDGKYYAIPRMTFSESILSSSDAAMLVRRDWMEALGISDPQNFEEFAAMTAAFAKDDPDGNGVDDTIGYNVNNSIALGKWVILGIAPECNTYGWVKTDDGLYVPSWTTDAFLDVVSAYRTLYECGGLDPDFYTKTPDAIMEDFAAGRLGALEYKSSAGALSELEQKWNLYNDQPFEDCVDVLHIFAAPDGNCYSNSSSLFWSESFLSSSVDDAKMERILCLYEYLLSEEGILLTKYGIEGVDYEVGEDGNLVSLLDTSQASHNRLVIEKYPSISLFANLASVSGGWEDFEETPMNVQRYGEHCVALASKDLLWNQENTIQVERPYDFQLFPKENSALFSTGDAFGNFVKCIIGSDDPLEMWASVMEEYRAQGLDDYIARQNQLYHERQTAIENSITE
ncbi:MAG: extracellular solute-binding protein [Eubacteriales bacterium]|nr:extracellular solute-binding protein [Eubacteriales bacterium]